MPKMYFMYIYLFFCRGKVTVFSILCDKYESSIKRDPTYKEVYYVIDTDRQIDSVTDFSTKRISSSSRWKLNCSRHDIAEKFCWVGVKQQSQLLTDM